MSKFESEEFSLYSWLLKKLRSKLLFCYLFTFLSSFFYYQATQGIKIWGHEKTDFPYRSLLISVDSRVSLLWYAFFCFFVGNILTNLVCEYLKSYSVEICRIYLRKLILKYSAINPQQTQIHRKEIMNSFLGEVELFVPLFVLVPQKIFAAIINIFLTIMFLNSFPPNKLSAPFIIFTSLAVAVLSFFSYKIQVKINRQQNQFRYQENIAMENYLENQENPKKVEVLINSNFRKNRASLWKKTISYLPTLVIPGLIILFCFIYSGWYVDNWEVKEFVQVFLIAGSIQTIFWKVKEITDNLPEISKINVHYKSLKKVLNKLRDK